ncbi:MAG TPA: hypothetical protein EYQ01_02335, partial [Nitrospira sp.]|nr:hypothetical protein [Candidatus Manganitrophaceae bacterium]
MKTLHLLLILLITLTGNHICNAFEIIEGEIKEITGPDDLNLDPQNAIIAVDVFGNADSIINGVEFYTDRDGLGAQTAGEGMVEKDGISITTTSTHTIDNWSNGGGGPSFTGDDADSVANLSEVMRDIRWSAAPSPVTIDITGLNAGSIYNVQLLFNEGADRNRGWDIAVNDELVVDNITSEGGDGFWSPENSFVYSGNFSATDDGTLVIIMQNQLGGEPPVAADNNPILQGIVLNSTTPATIISFVGPLTDDESTGISTDNTYTHTISGGGAETVNGVEFELLNNSTTPEDFYWDVSSVKNQLDDNNGGWSPGAGGVTGPGLQALLGSFTFNNDGAIGSNQSFTLNGLTEGQYYELRLYARKWDDSTQRQQTIEFISGDITDTVTFSEDHPETEPTNMESRDQAYYISYRYTAGDDEDLIVEFTVTDDEVQGAPGSFHMYGLTNQIAAPPSDLDQDGLPDSWEEALVDNLDDLNGNGAGPGPGSGTGDFDGDGLTDIDEYEETKTDPTKADTDEDGLSDGVETNTGTYVSATNTGTDPKEADTDDDGLLDGVETNTGILVDNDDTGTDPHNRDTDGDNYGDGGEIAGGTDPHDPNSKGALLPPFLYVDFEEEAEDLSGNGYNGVVDGLVSFDVEGAPDGPTPRTGASFTGGHIDFPDIDMNSMINTFEDGSYTFACWLKPIGSAGGQGFMWGQTNQGIHNGIRSGGLLHSAHWGADWNASTVLVAEEWVHAVWTYDGEADSAAIYLNGQLDGGPIPQRAPNGGGTFLFGARNNGTEQYDGEVDDVAIWREVLPEGMIQALADGASPIGAGGAGATYSQNFDEYDDGTTDLDDGSIIFGQAASVQDGRLQLTIDQQGLGFSSFSVPALPGSSQGFTVTFDYELYDSPGANDPADGFSFNYGDAPLGDQGQAEEGMATRPGVTENISWEVDTWRNDDAEQGVNISGIAGGADLGELDFTNGIILEDDSRKTGTMEIRWNPTNGASFTTTGLTTNADFSEVDTGAFVANDEHNFIISARVGGANEDLFIDNLVIAVAGTDDADGDGLPDYWEEKYGVDDPEGDPDNDGLTNIEEFELRTKPDMADSDEDGLTDKEEIEVHNTNPLNPDADRDGLLDGEEIAAGTDPENKDTDGDGISDFNEIQDGTDPLVVTAIAFETNLVSYWPLDSDFDDAKAENHGVEEGGPIEFQTGKFDGAIYLNGSQS